MENVAIRVEDKKLILEVDLSASVRQTGRGNTLVATTDNWVKVPEAGAGYSLNLALVRK